MRPPFSTGLFVAAGNLERFPRNDVVPRRLTFTSAPLHPGELLFAREEGGGVWSSLPDTPSTCLRALPALAYAYTVALLKFSFVAQLLLYVDLTKSAA